MYFPEAIEAGGLISGWNQVTVHLVRDVPTYLKIPNGFFEFILVIRGWVAFKLLIGVLVLQ